MDRATKEVVVNVNKYEELAEKVEESVEGHYGEHSVMVGTKKGNKNDIFLQNRDELKEESVAETKERVIQ